uniref:EF-hand domain-containing protein n=1 Tax=Spumella elongata TaxID=89044 RepID=A0A7S3GN15_9STRA
MKEFHAAATAINCLYRKNKAVSIVKHKKLQNQIEVALLNEQRFQQALVVIQKSFRMCSVRMWIHSFGKDFNRELVRRSASVKIRKKRASNAFQNKNKPVLNSQHKRERVTMDGEKRVKQNRMNLMHTMETLYSTVIQLLEANILAWHAKHTQLLPTMQAQLTLRDSLYELHKFESTENLKILLNCTNNERDRRELLVKSLHIKLEAASTRLENTRNMVWWITQHLRMLYRKLSILKVRFQDTLLRIQWVSIEYAILQRMEYHMEKRVTVLSTSIPEMLPVAEWVKGYLSLVVKQCILLDCMQETMLKEEINRLHRDERIVVEFDSLIVELLNSLHADNQYSAEKVHLDVALKYEVYGSAKGIELNEQLIALKSKQKTLTTHTLDNLKTGLQEKYDLEDTNNLADYGFPNDNPDLPIEQLHTIEAVMMETFNNAAKHCKLYDFLSVYLVQPWLAEQSVEDVRLEEQISQKELSVGTLREQLKNIRVMGKNNEIKKTNNEKRIKALGVELEGKYEGRDGEGESEAKDRLALVANMQQEILALQTENTMIVNNRADITAQEAPILFEISNISNDIGKIQESLKTRADARAKQSKIFFELERTCAAELAALAETQTVQCEYTMMDIEKHISLCEQYSSSDDVIQGVIDNTNIELRERVPINVPLQTLTHKVHQLNHNFRPRTCSTAIHAVRTTIQTRLSILRLNLGYYESVKTLLDKEITDLTDFPNKLEYYLNAVKAFDTYAVNNRRQRALQIEINLRKLRLEALRGMRLQTMMEAKQKQIEQDKLVATKQAEKAAAKKSVVKELAKNTKLAIRAAQDKIRDMRYQNDIEMDAEEQKMARNIREKSKEGVGSIPEAIKEICFTWGREKTDFFQQQNDHLKSKGLPFFVRMPRSIGNSVYIWTQSTKDSNFFITHFELAHPDPANELLYKEQQMRKKHFELIETGGTKMQIWVKRDRRREYGIKNISLSFTEEEETRLIVDKYSKIDISLSEFGLPDTFLWIEKVDKVKTVEVDNTNKLIAEIKKVKALLDTKPDDKNIQAVVERLGLKLEAAHAKEKEAEVTNPLQAATDLLALNESELSQWMQVFRSIDKKKASRVTLMDVFEYFEETPTPVTREVFLGAESLDREGLMEFGDFVRACAIFCLFGKQELIQFLYVFVDKDRVGYMTYEDFSQLLESLHPYEKLRARRVLKALNHPKDYHVDFKEFSSYCDRFPAAYSPIFNLQNAMRKKTMGIDWWFHKMQKYKEVRRKMGAEGGNIQQIVDTELQRFTDDALREKRMAERDAKIKQETSEVKKVIMQARQFLDEFS